MRKGEKNFAIEVRRGAILTPLLSRKGKKGGGEEKISLVSLGRNSLSALSLFCGGESRIPLPFPLSGWEALLEGPASLKEKRRKLFWRKGRFILDAITVPLT